MMWKTIKDVADLPTDGHVVYAWHRGGVYEPNGFPLMGAFYMKENLWRDWPSGNKRNPREVVAWKEIDKYEREEE